MLGALIPSSYNPDEIENIANDKHIEDDFYNTNKFFKEEKSNEHEYHTFLKKFPSLNNLYVVTNRYFYGDIEKNIPIFLFCKIDL